MASTRFPLKYAAMHRRQLEDTLAAWRTPKQPRPRIGWIKSIRLGLRMSAKALAARLGITESGLRKLEVSEKNETISLATLRRVAEAMECELQYAFVPRASLQEILQDRAIEQARKILVPTSHSMMLEAQTVIAKKTEEQIQELAKELLGNKGKDLW